MAFQATGPPPLTVAQHSHTLQSDLEWLWGAEENSAGAGLPILDRMVSPPSSSHLHVVSHPYGLSSPLLSPLQNELLSHSFSSHSFITY